MLQEKYLYFRTEADEDDDDDSARSALYPVSSFKGVHPTSDTALTLFFQPQIRNGSDAQDGNVVNNDSIVLNINQGKATEVMQDIVSAINGGPHSDGFITVADDATTDFLGTTKAAVYVSGDITSCGAISIAAALS
tara:strand:+ start:2559 stop:2966 length:408 start_codon:yes stop_codon:yes gene_type:complete